MGKWQNQVEEILREKFPNEIEVLVKEATKMLGTPVEPPSGEMGKVIAELMRQASKELRPLAAVYVGFQLGVSWERYTASQGG